MATTRYTANLRIDDVISMDRDGVTSYYHKDGLGSIRQLTDATEAIVNTYSYNAFGTIRTQSETVSNPYKFTARRLDTESTLYYYRARYYNASIGRFISKDPLRGNIYNPPSLNRYVYVVNNPVNWVDPWGLEVNGPYDNLSEDIEQAHQEGKDITLYFNRMSPEQHKEAMHALGNFFGGTYGEIIIPDKAPFKNKLIEILKEWLGDWFTDQTSPDDSKCK